MRSLPRLALVLLTGLLTFRPEARSEERIPSAGELEAAGARIGKIQVERLNIFDLRDPEQDHVLYRFANRLHTLTREAVIRRELLFREGDLYRQKLIDESARNLRALNVIYHVQIRPASYQEGVVDLIVSSQDTWTMRPSVRISRAGGDTSTGFSFSEQNFLGRVKLLQVSHRNDIDRSTTSLLYADPRLFGSRFALRALYQDSSDGLSRGLSVARPFFSLDSRWSANASGQHLDQNTHLFQNGDRISEFRQISDSVAVSYGFSPGYDSGRVFRYGLGWAYLRNDFSQDRDGLDCALNPSEERCGPVPLDQKFSGPVFTFERLGDRYITVSNYNQFDRIEDFNLGNDFVLSSQFSLRTFGAERSEVILSVADSFGVELSDLINLFYNVSLSGRTGGGELSNAVFSQVFEAYWRITPHQTFYTRLGLDAGIHLDLQNQFLLGGDTGLRGYPTRQFAGDRRLLLTVEHRVFTEWEILKLVRIGFAGFADLGDAWYGSTGQKPSDLHPDLGFGLRFAVSRSTVATVSRLDLAYSLDAEETDSPHFQVLFGTALKF